MEIDTYVDGVPSWIDLGSPDVDKARAFYGALFGWETPEGPPEAGGYTVCTLRGRTVAGLGPKMQPEAPTAWLSYVNVDDLDATLEKVIASGGQVLMPAMDVMEAGRMAIFADPQGAVIGLWQPKEHKGAGLVNEPGTFSWSELVTNDVDAAKSFYGAVFGWEAVDQGPEGTVAYTEWKVGDQSVGGMMAKPEAIPAEVPPFWGVYFAVEDCDAAVTKATGLGASLFMPATDIEPGRFAVLADPQGAMFNVIALKPGLGG